MRLAIAAAVTITTFSTLQCAHARANTESRAGSPRMLGVFGDNMVLQHDQPLMNGCGAAPGAVLVAEISAPAGQAAWIRADERVQTTADANGCFVFALQARPPTPAAAAAAGGYVVQVRAGASPGAAVVASAAHVLFGRVVLCGGQSNMVHPVSYDYNASAQLAAVGLLPNLRLFQVGRQWATRARVDLALGCDDNGTVPALTPGCTVRNQWWPAGAQNASLAAGFSAVCYFTAQELMRTEWGSQAAVGLIEADWGGSAEQAWQTREPAATRGCVLPPPANGTAGGACPLTTPHISPTKEYNWGCLFHGMIAPLAVAVRPALALWYQGEANQRDDVHSTEPELRTDYACILEAMVAEWRQAFASPALPFFAVQLAPYYGAPSVVAGLFPHTRVAQASALSAVSAPAGYAVTHDLGDQAGGIHPHNKTEVGRRLAIAVRRHALNRTSLPATWAATTARASGGMLHVAVAPVGDAPAATTPDLAWRPTQQCTRCCTAATRVLEACAGTNCTESSPAWRPLPAVASGDAITAQLPAGTSPQVVRYAWSDYPECVISAANGLPLGPFLMDVAST